MKKLGIFVCCAVLVLLCAVPVCAAGALSPALALLQEECAVCKTGVGVNTVSFCEEDFLAVFGEDDVRGVVITRLPDERDGTLMLGASRVTQGQTVARESLAALRFIPAEAGRTASFGFLPYGRAYERDFVCTVYMLDALNFSPRASASSLVAVENVPVYATLTAEDPDGDALTYRVVDAPFSGTLTLSADGSYCYVPSGTSQDRFTYVALDPYGNCSAPATVTVDVVKNKSGIVYADMQDARDAMPAVMLAESGAFVGERVGDTWYFHPDKTVTRGEFLMMAMKMNGIEADLLAPCDAGFADSASFTATEDKYISAAARLGIVVGIETEDGRCFCPDEPITSVQASTVISRIARLGGAALADAVLASADVAAEVSDEGLSMLREVGLACETERNAPLTRADAASLLYTLSLIA
ncbi:MAG: hypothetical protein IJV98_00950 [Clostridia bacterium]|nr:hypothetical protein [Clostridia bacterium]